LQVYLVLMATTVPVVQRQLELKASGRWDHNVVFIFTRWYFPYLSSLPRQRTWSTVRSISVSELEEFTKTISQGFASFLVSYKVQYAICMHML
jgi:hypothetical protein